MDNGPMRIQKYLSMCGVCSRRKAEQFIAQGRVSVNGAAVTEPGVRVNPESDVVALDGRVVFAAARPVYAMLNKPPGVLSSASDDRGRRCAVDLLPPELGRLYPVGRLDYDSEGLLLLTNDGAFTNHMTHPRYHIDKTYAVTAAGAVTPAELDKLRRGVALDDGYVTRPCRVRSLGRRDGQTLLEVVLSEGKNRQIRRMLDAVGHPVVRLTRTAVGPVELGGLESGAWRHLTGHEIRELKREVSL